MCELVDSGLSFWNLLYRNEMSTLKSFVGMDPALPCSGSRKNALQPSSVHRTSTEAQAGIRGLRSSSAMDCIPTEVLAYILEFAIQTSSPLCPLHGVRKK